MPAVQVFTQTISLKSGFMIRDHVKISVVSLVCICCRTKLCIPSIPLCLLYTTSAGQSPVIMQGLSNGNHFLRVSPVGCQNSKISIIRFNV